MSSSGRTSDKSGSRLVIAERAGDTVLFRLKGTWSLDNGLLRIKQFLPDDAAIRTIRFDGSGLRGWDTTLIAFLFDAHGYAAAQGITLDTTGLPESVDRLLKLATAVPEKDTGDDDATISRLDRVGGRALEVGSAINEQLNFVGEVFLGLGRLLSGRTSMRWRDFWVVIEDHGPRALPIVLLICFLVGLIIAFLGSVVLTQFGAGIYNAHLVGYGMLRELGALMTAIIMVGRSGAAFAAEIGSMKVSEELDAYTTLGVSAIDFIVLPRMLALFLMMPILTIFGDVVGVLGGMLVSSAVMDISPSLFLSNLFGAISFSDFALGVFKGTVFGGLIGVSGCLRGMQCGSSADAVGKATTSAVVTGITLVIFTNAIIDWLASVI